jgi:hypothetical protein
LITEQVKAWEWFYPWLRTGYTLHVVDGYSPDQAAVEAGSQRLSELVEGVPEFWWLAITADDGVGISQNENSAPAPVGAEITQPFFADPDVQTLETQQFGDCRLSRIAQRPAAPLAVAEVAGGPIYLLQTAHHLAQAGNALHLVLYWQADAPVTARYTVFTQLFSPTGELVAQQDNWPVEGLAPTDSWQPGVIIRDPYRLAIPHAVEAGTYRLRLGLYLPEGRRPLRLSDGLVQAYVEVPIQIDR